MFNLATEIYHDNVDNQNKLYYNISVVEGQINVAYDTLQQNSEGVICANTLCETLPTTSRRVPSGYVIKNETHAAKFKVASSLF